tara:strand:- start:51 stop:197 length:147 start_codon:yes stop_codon:yes gene_type:complete
MPSSYQKRCQEIDELRMKVAELNIQVKEMTRAIEILNNYIYLILHKKT